MSCECSEPEGPLIEVVEDEEVVLMTREKTLPDATSLDWGRKTFDVGTLPTASLVEVLTDLVAEVACNGV